MMLQPNEKQRELLKQLDKKNLTPKEIHEIFVKVAEAKDNPKGIVFH